MNEHDRALLELYDLIMAKKVARMHLRFGSRFSGMADVVGALRKMSPEEMLSWAKKSNEELNRMNGK